MKYKKKKKKNVNMRNEQFHDENEIPGGRCISNKNTL